MQYASDKPELLAVGEGPVLLEPVQAIVQLQKVKKGKVHVLDHAGRRTGKSFNFRKNKIFLEGAKYQTLYYEIEKE
jgi:hypothetical protein